MDDSSQQRSAIRNVVWNVAVPSGIVLLVSSSIASAQTCGPEALAVVLESLGLEVERSELVDALPGGGEYSSLQELADVARDRFGVRSLGIHWDSPPPTDAPPAILPVPNNKGTLHFIAVTDWKPGQIAVTDGDTRAILEFSVMRKTGWNGDALQFANVRSDLYSIAPQWWKSDRIKSIASLTFFIVAATLVVMPSIRKRPTNTGRTR